MRANQLNQLNKPLEQKSLFVPMILKGNCFSDIPEVSFWTLSMSFFYLILLLYLIYFFLYLSLFIDTPLRPFQIYLYNFKIDFTIMSIYNAIKVMHIIIMCIQSKAWITVPVCIFQFPRDRAGWFYSMVHSSTAGSGEGTQLY